MYIEQYKTCILFSGVLHFQDHSWDDLMETSTHYSTYSGLKFPVTLSKMHGSVKEKILGQRLEPASWPSGHGIPLFWQESKIKDFWATLFQNLGAALVVDLECGSGEAAKAAMESSIYYIGFAKDSHHQSWVSNNVDREALRQITKQGQMLFNATLAESISEIFKTELEKEKTEAVLLEGEQWSDNAPAREEA